MVQTLETARLLLRPLTRDDLPFLAAMNADPVVARYLATGKPRPEAETRDWLEKTLRWYGEDGAGHLGIVLKEDGRLVGRCGLQPFEVEQGAEPARAWFGRGSAPTDARTAVVLELGYGLVPEAWGKGLASEASRRMREVGFSRGEPKLMSVIHADNAASIKVAEKNGFSWRGELDFGGRIFRRYQLTRAEWEALPPAQRP
jgi:RimJ/RimL family protein N-acetyltransferase